jgi:replicative DNA helicase
LSDDTSAPAHAIQAEQAVIGAILQDNNILGVIADTGISAHDLFDPLHAGLYDEIQRKTTLGEKVTVITLAASFPTASMSGMSISEYLRSCISMAGDIADTLESARLIKSFSVQRSLIDVAKALRENPFPADEALTAAWSKIDAIRMGVVGRRKYRVSATIEESTQETMDYITRVRNNEVTGGIKIGLTLLDTATGGFQRGELVIIAGRPAMGKSMVAVSVARQVAKNGNGVGFFSLEMPERDISRRFLTDQAYDMNWRHPIPYSNVFRPNGVSQAEHELLNESQRIVRSLPMELDYSSHLSVAEIGAKARGMITRLQQNYSIPLSVVFIDYLKFIKATKTYRGQRTYEIGEITAALKGLAKDLNICVVLLAQMNRESEKRDEKKPRLSDLRDSGDIESDADVVLMLYREAYYLLQEGLDKGAEISTKIAAAENLFEIYVAKQRMGPTGWHRFHCCMASSSVRDLDFNGNAPTHEEFR